MADNQLVMGSNPPAEPVLPHLRPSGVGRVSWAIAHVAGGAGLRYGVLLVAIATGLVGSAALLGHAANAPALAAYERNVACGAGGSVPPDCRVVASGPVLEDRPLPFGIHEVTLAVDGRRAIYYGWADTYYSGGLPANSDALLVAWRGRVARVVGPGLTLEPFEGPPGAGFLLIALAVVCELVCGLALGLQGVLWRLRARVVPIGAARSGGLWVAAPGRMVFLGAMVVALLAGRSGHAIVAAPLHALCGIVMATGFAVAGVASARELVPVARRGLDALSEEPALRLGADIALASVLVALCLSLATDLVVADLLTLPR
jgi:hypothetical protein